MALANHNYIGYVNKTLIKYKVRWIEAAIACPAWTTMICFYLEEDRGHLMREVWLESSYILVFPFATSASNCVIIR